MMRRATRERRPLIGVTTSAARGVCMWRAAKLALQLQGCRAVRLTANKPTTPDDWRALDGLMIGGGDDIGATLYGLKPLPNVRVDPARDTLELAGLSALWSSERPILGVCRGAQMLNVFKGGSLHQDIYEIYREAPRMRTVLPRKLVRLDAGRLSAALTVRELLVNALHHQSIDALGEGLRIVGRDQWGMVQAVETPSGPFRVGVQWHPEYLIYSARHRRLFAAFADAARRSQAQRSAAPANASATT